MISSLLVSYFLHQVTLPSYREKSLLDTVQTISETGSGTLTLTVLHTPGGTVAKGAQRVEMLSLTLVASCDADISVNSIVLHRKGLGSREDIAGVYAMEGNRRVSNSRTFNSRDEEVQLVFKDLQIPACEGIELSLLADFTSESSSAGEHRIEVQGAGAIESSAHTVRISEASKPQIRRIVGQSVGMITFEALPLLQTVRYGSSRVVARFRMTVSNGDDHEVAAITLTNQGSARNSDLRNIAIQSTRKRITSVLSQIEGDHVRLVFDPPMLLKRNDTRVFELRADVRAGRSKTLQFILEEPGDIEATPVVRRR